MTRCITHIIVLTVITSALLTATAAAKQPADSTMHAKRQHNDSVFCGISTHIDIASPLMGIAINKNVQTIEAQIDINILNRFYPTAEIGYGNVNTTAHNGSCYTVSALFWRIGMNYNLLKKRDNTGNRRSLHNYPFIGLRYGMSVLPYTLDNVPVDGGYWGGIATRQYRGHNIYTGWAEIVAGVRIDLYKGLTMGWSVRLRLLLHAMRDKAMLWYVPGYGRNDGPTFTFNYTIGYTWRTSAERARVNAAKAQERAATKVVIK